MQDNVGPAWALTTVLLLVIVLLFGGGRGTGSDGSCAANGWNYRFHQVSWPRSIVTVVPPVPLRCCWSTLAELMFNFRSKKCSNYLPTALPPYGCLECLSVFSPLGPEPLFYSCNHLMAAHICVKISQVLGLIQMWTLNFVSTVDSLTKFLYKKNYKPAQ